MSTRFGSRLLVAPAGLMAGLLVVPVASLVLATSPEALVAGLRHPGFGAAIAVSARTSVVSLAVVVALGLPLAGWLATSRGLLARVVEAIVDTPIVLPPAVLGVALLQAYGRAGLLGDAMGHIGIALPFTAGAVIMAQVVVSAPFFVQSATAALRRVDPDLVLVARTLGASPFSAFLRVALPLAAPGIVSGVGLAWARALGEFGATLLFAGSREGVTRTMPLAIFSALESDVRLALALSLSLAGLAMLVLGALRVGAAARWGAR